MAMRIGELAQQAGTSVKTIRYYDRIGVLPASQRTEAGYRLYGDDSLNRYRFVRAAQAVGLHLGEVRQIIRLRDRGETPCAFVVGLIQRRAAELDERIAELEALRDELKRLTSRAEQLDARSCDPQLICHVIEQTSPSRDTTR